MISTSAPGSCQRLLLSSAQDELTSYCAGAVDYSFFVPSNTTLSHLNEVAINQTSTLMSMLPNSCQMDIKRLICASVYLRCPDNISISNISTWNYAVYPSVPFPLPFQRPCLSVCTTTVNSCIGLPNLLGLGSELNCSSLTDYSWGQLPPPVSYANTYDGGNDPAICNAMATGVFEVALSSEVYLGANDPGAACYGITSELYIPPANSIDPSLAPMLPPYVVQTIIDSNLAASFEALPKFLSEECHSSLRTYFCSSYMLKPTTLSLGEVVATNLAAAGIPAQSQSSVLNSLGIPSPILAAILNYSFTLYSYPLDTVCVDYESKCGAFIQIANQSSLLPNCHGHDKYGAAMFPGGVETIQTFDVSGLGPIRVNTTANPANSTNDSGYQTTCPTGYVVPEEPSDPRINWIPGTGCAVSCQAPVWTPQEWESFYNTCLVVPWLAVVVGIAYIISVIRFPHKIQHEFPLLLYAISSVILSCFFGIMHSNSFHTQFCKSNAVNYSNVDGFNWCNMQSVMLWYFGLAIGLSCVCIACDQFRKVVMNMSDFPYHLTLQVIIVFGLPWISTIWILLHQDYGYQRPTNLCLGAGNNDYTYFWKPFEAFTAFDGIVILFVIVFVIFKRVNTDLTPLIFLVLLFPVQVTIIESRYSITNSYDKSLMSFSSFTQCVFKNFNGSDSSWQLVCGLHPTFRASFANTQWVYVCINGLPLFLIIAHILNPQNYAKESGFIKYQAKVVPVEDVEK